MEKIICWLAFLLTMSLATAAGKNGKGGSPAKMENDVKASHKTAIPDWEREKLANAVQREKFPDKIIGKRFVFSGPFVAFVKSDNPVRTFNPFSAANNDITADERFDRYLPRARGITLIRIGF